MKRLIFIWIILSFLPSAIFAQGDTESIFQSTDPRNDFKEHSITFVPQYIFIHGLRADVEHRIMNQQWIQISAEVYSKNKSTGILTNDFKNMTGCGIGINHKIYIDPTDPTKHGVYFSYGAAYRDFTMTYKEGLLLEGNTSIHALSGNIIFGYQNISPLGIVYDFYAGAGMQRSIQDYSSIFEESSAKSYNTTQWDYGYSGAYFILGFKIGFLF